MLAAPTGVLQLTVTVMVWGRAWTAVAAALAGAANVHWIAASLIAPRWHAAKPATSCVASGRTPRLAAPGQHPDALRGKLAAPER